MRKLLFDVVQLGVVGVGVEVLATDMQTSGPPKRQQHRHRGLTFYPIGSAVRVVGTKGAHN